MKGLCSLGNLGGDQGRASTTALKWERMFEEPSEPEEVGVLQTNNCIACNEVGNGDGKCQTRQMELPVALLFKEKWETFAELKRGVTSPDLRVGSSR